VNFIDTVVHCSECAELISMNRECCLDNDAQQGHFGSSKRNPFEITLVVNLVKHLFANIRLNPSRRLSLSDIGIISPYWAQVMGIRHALKEHGIIVKECMDNSVVSFGGREIDSVEVNTVDGYQGREKPIIIVSLVRTATMGFLTDSRRVNVMFTRAKHGLFVIGHGPLLSETRPDWTSWMDFLTARQCFVQAAPLSERRELRFGFACSF